MNERFFDRTSVTRDWFLVLILTVSAGVGCSRSPDVQPPDPPVADTPTVSPQVAALGLEEGDIHYKTAYRYKSLSVFDPPTVEKIPFIVQGGRLVPVDPAEPVDDGVVYQQGIMYYDPPQETEGTGSAAQTGEADPWSGAQAKAPRRPQKGTRLPEFLEAAPEAARSTSRMEIAASQRISSPGLLLDLASAGIQLQYRQTAPPPIGATEVVELFLDGGIRGAIEQFEDPEELAAWFRANTQMMKDMGMDPEEHMALRGLTLVRVGEGGHPLAMERVRGIALVNAKDGFMPATEGTPSTCSR